MSDDEATALRVTMIGGQRYPDDFTVIWRGLPIGRIMQASGLPPHVSEWRWTCNCHGKPDDDGGSGVELDDCKAKFRVRMVADTRRAVGCGHREGARDAALTAIINIAGSGKPLWGQ